MIPILATLEGMVSDTSDVQKLKAPLDIVVTLLGIVTDTSDVQ